jgi:hypothetical protein
MDEVSYAMSQGKKIVPLMIENCAIPFRLARLQYIDFTRNYDTAFPGVLKALTADQSAAAIDPSSQTEPPQQEIGSYPKALKRRKYLKPVAIVFLTIGIVALLIIFIRPINNKPDNTIGAVPDDTVETVHDTLVTVKNAIVLSDKTSGGSDGMSFNDLNSISEDAKVSGIIINHGDLINDIRFIWDGIASSIHGEAPKGGEDTMVFFSNDEYVTSISGYLGRDPYGTSDVIGSVTISTNKRIFGSYGMKAPDNFNLTAKDSFEIVGLYGRAGQFMNALGILEQRITGNTVPEQSGYQFVIRGGGGLRSLITPSPTAGRVTLNIRFVFANHGAINDTEMASLEPGEGAWLDRGVRTGEPPVLQYETRAGTANKIADALKSSSGVLKFECYNKDNRYLQVTKLLFAFH